MGLRVATLEARVEQLQRLVRAADFALMALLVAVIGIGVRFSVDAVMEAVNVEREQGSSTLADAIRAAVGRGDQRIRLGLWLAARQEDPIGRVRTRKVGATDQHSGLYELIDA